MIRLALAFSSKDRCDLSVRTIEPLLHHPNVDVFWLDGSSSEEGQALPGKTQLAHGENHHLMHHPNVRGGADAAIVYALSIMLAGQDYTHVGLVENDVLLHSDWLGPTLALFDRGASEGLAVGAVSARCYQDRILCQRDGYALCHNLGAGQVIFTRQAARLILDNFRGTFTMENRKLFAQLTGKDIGTWWAFGASDHWLTADWAFDKVLSAHGLASLALTPSPVEMLDQDPALLGLKIVTEPFELLRDDAAFARYATFTQRIRAGDVVAGTSGQCFTDASGHTTIFPHQLKRFGADFRGNWRLRWQQGFGPFAYRAGSSDEFPFYHTPPGTTQPVLQHCTVTIPLLGPAHILVGGGKTNGQVHIVDEVTGYECKPDLPPDADGQNALAIDIPAGCVYRNVKVTMLTPGATLFGIRVRDPQPYHPDLHFDHQDLPPP